MDTICPECAVGKHDNCNGLSWDNEKDSYTPCPCAVNDHKKDDL